MGHMTNVEYLNKNNIDEYFTALAKKVNERGIGHHRILVVGGAAMAIKYHDGRSTVDIDICFREQNNLYSCCHKLIKKRHLWCLFLISYCGTYTYGKS